MINFQYTESIIKTQSNSIRGHKNIVYQIWNLEIMQRIYFKDSC
jgi:hypothetical protein